MLKNLRKNQGGFTLVEIMIVVAIIALLAAIAVPNFLRARKRSQATTMLEELRILDAAIDQYAIDNNKPSGSVFYASDLKPYLKKDSRLYNTGDQWYFYDLFGIPYWTTNVVDSYGNYGYPNVAIDPYEVYLMKDAVDPEFWSPYSLGINY